MANTDEGATEEVYETREVTTKDREDALTAVLERMTGQSGRGDEEVTDWISIPDAELIANAPTDLRALLDDRAALVAENARLTEALLRIKNEMVASPEDAGPYFKSVAAAVLDGWPEEWEPNEENQLGGQMSEYQPVTLHRKRTATVGFEWDGTDECAEAINAWAGSYVVDFKRDESKHVQLWVEANKAWLNLEPDEWVMKDHIGCYPCKAEIIALNYDRDNLDEQDEP